MYDTIIIGGGPAGVTAGIYAARKKLKTLLLTRDFLGQAAKTGEIDNWPGSPSVSGVALMQNFEKHLKNFEIEIREGVEVVLLEKRFFGRLERPQNDTHTQNDIHKHKEANFAVKISTSEVFESKTVIVCSGATPRKLGVVGEEKFLGKGVSFCSLCDAPFFTKKDVVVAGSGNSGLEAALDLSKYANKIFLIEASGALRGDPLLQDMVQKTGKVEILLNAQVKEIKGKDMVEEVVVAGEAGDKTLKASGVFVEIGWDPQSDFLNGLVEKNKKGEIVINQATGATSTAGLFGAGDCCNLKYKQIILACASGAVAALGAFEFLQGQTSQKK